MAKCPNQRRDPRDHKGPDEMSSQSSQQTRQLLRDPSRRRRRKKRQTPIPLCCLLLWVERSSVSMCVCVNGGEAMLHVQNTRFPTFHILCAVVPCLVSHHLPAYPTSHIPMRQTHICKAQPWGRAHSSSAPLRLVFPSWQPAPNPDFMKIDHYPMTTHLLSGPKRNKLGPPFFSASDSSLSPPAATARGCSES
jgi:hypothetical protein